MYPQQHNNPCRLSISFSLGRQFICGQRRPFSSRARTCEHIAHCGWTGPTSLYVSTLCVWRSTRRPHKNIFMASNLDRYIYGIRRKLYIRTGTCSIFEAHHAASVRRPKVARPMRRVIGINIKIILRTPHTHIREPPFAPAHPPRAQRVCGERCWFSDVVEPTCGYVVRWGSLFYTYAFVYAGLSSELGLLDQFQCTHIAL